VNIYDLLRALTIASSKSGLLGKQDAFNALNLLEQLEKLSAFGTVGSITNGGHPFTSADKYCNICGKGEYIHE
jgi:hypothetical protein